ncbi:MAG: efflux RND transporter periplasmic adaptor subunit [Ginsengibacter sp.]
MKSKILFTKALLIISLVASVINFAGCNSGNVKVAANEKEEIYTCSMHPQIISHQPGRCPICGMNLVKKENAVRELTQADLSALIQPVNSTVLSTVPVTALQRNAQVINIKAVGTVEYDTRYMKTISAWVSGRIDKLYVRYRFQAVHAGQKVMDIYSPELLTAQQNLLFLLKNDPGNTSLIQAAKQKLLWLGMSKQQLRSVITDGKAYPNISVYSPYTGHVHEAGQFTNSPAPLTLPTETPALQIKEGMYVNKGQPVFQVNDMRHVWVSLSLYPDDNSFIKKGAPVTIIPETEPDKKIQSIISFIEPFYRENSRNLTARVYLNNGGLMIPVGSQVTATIDEKTAVKNWLPETSVLSLGLNKVVFLKQGKVFKVQPVSTGISANNLIEITNGLNTTDSVAANAQFLVDSEGFIKVK